MTTGMGVVGVTLKGAKTAGTLCRDHWSAAKAADTKKELTFFTVKAGRQECTLCKAIRKSSK